MALFAPASAAGHHVNGERAGVEGTFHAKKKAKQQDKMLLRKQTGLQQQQERGAMHRARRSSHMQAGNL